MGALRPLKRRLSGLVPRLTCNKYASWSASGLAVAAIAVVTVPFGSGATVPLADAVTGHGLGQLAAAPRAAAVRTAARILAVTVRRGDTLSAISARVCGTAYDWSGLYAANRRELPGGPDSIEPGQVLAVRCYDPGYTYPRPRQPKPVPHVRKPVQQSVQAVSAPVAPAASGPFTTAGIEALWESAGGPAWAAPHAAEIAYCESGYNPRAYNPSGATGLWQILGSVVPGNLDDPAVNAENAVAKFKASGDTFAQWVCT